MLDTVNLKQYILGSICDANYLGHGAGYAAFSLPLEGRDYVLRIPIRSLDCNYRDDSERMVDIAVKPSFAAELEQAKLIGTNRVLEGLSVGQILVSAHQKGFRNDAFPTFTIHAMMPGKSLSTIRDGWVDLDMPGKVVALSQFLLEHKDAVRKLYYDVAGFAHAARNLNMIDYNIGNILFDETTGDFHIIDLLGMDPSANKSVSGQRAAQQHLDELTHHLTERLTNLLRTSQLDDAQIKAASPLYDMLSSIEEEALENLQSKQKKTIAFRNVKRVDAAVAEMTPHSLAIQLRELENVSNALKL